MFDPFRLRLSLLAQLYRLRTVDSVPAIGRVGDKNPLPPLCGVQTRIGEQSRHILAGLPVII